MKNFKLTTTMILGAITIAELAFRKDMEGSIVLWCLYGIYKLSTYDRE